VLLESLQWKRERTGDPKKANRLPSKLTPNLFTKFRTKADGYSGDIKL